MKVFFILDNAFPSNNPSAKRVKCYSKGLNYNNIDTEILTISHKGDPSESEDLAYKMIGKGHDDTLLSKICVFFQNIIALKKYLKIASCEEDIIYLYSDGLIVGLLPILLGLKRKYVREMCEIPYYSYKLIARINRWIYLHLFFKQYDGVVAISTSLEQIANKYKNKKCKVIKIPILVDFSKYQTVTQCDNSSNIIFHSGSHTEAKDGFYGMIESIGLLKEKYNDIVHLYCTGKEPNSESYLSIIKRFGLDNQIHYLGYISEKELLQWQETSFCFIINKYDSFQNKYCFATKLGEYLASERAVITTSIGEVIYYLKDGENAIIVEPGKPELIANSIHNLLIDNKNRQMLAHKGRILANEKFDCNKNGTILKDYLLKL